MKMALRPWIAKGLSLAGLLACGDGSAGGGLGREPGDGGGGEGADGVLRGDLRLSTDAVDFGTVPFLPGTAHEAEIVATNVGPGVVFLDGLDAGEPSDPAFSFDLDPVDLRPGAPGESARIRVTFAPTREGLHEASVRLRATIAGESVETPIRAFGRAVPPLLSARPPRLAFGNVATGAAKTLEIEVSNPSDTFRADARLVAPVNLAVCGANAPAAFCVEPVDDGFAEDPSFTLQAGESVALRIRFAPTIAATEERGRLALSYCPQTECEIHIDVTGSSVENGLRCAPERLSFGSVSPGVSARRSVTCTNTAHPQLTVLGAELTPESPPAFVVEDPPRGAVLAPASPEAPGGEIQIPVVFTPNDLGEDEGVLRVLVEDPDPRRSEVRVPLQGRGGGPDIEVSPAQVSFGLVPRGGESTRQVVISNTGFEDLIINDIVVDSLGTGAFASDDAAADIIEPGGSRIVNLTFRPSEAGPVETRMVIHSNDPDESPLEVLLRGG